jgi:DNA uptake protein ComE-like DNA-binding protein
VATFDTAALLSFKPHRESTIVIQFTDTHSLAQTNAARLGPNHGYRIEGDIALLHADIALSSAHRSQWALQLWACERPFSGGTLRGVKVAEAALPLADAAETQRLDAEALARVPGGQRDYSMVLVLASGSNGAFDQIHDFANYPARERFITPHLDGSVGYQIDGSEVVLRADGIRNPRAADNLSGSLALELWALTDTYQGGPVESGSLLASVDVGRIAGESTIVSFEQRVTFNPPVAGRWNVVLMLREWAPAGYVTRDFCTFAQQYEVAELSAQPRLENTRDAHELAAVPLVENTLEALKSGAQPSVENTFEAQQVVAQPTVDNTAETLKLRAQPSCENTTEAQEIAAQPTVDDAAEALKLRAQPSRENTTEAQAIAAQPTVDKTVETPKLGAQPSVENTAEAPKPVEALRALAEVRPSAETKVDAPKVATHANGTNGSALPQPVANAPAKPVAAAKPAPVAVANDSVVTASPAVRDTVTAASVTNATTAAKDGLVSIMRSSVEEIAQLKGLTRKIAVEVVKDRPYTSLDELTRVRGIGPKLLVKLRGQITL